MNPMILGGGKGVYWCAQCTAFLHRECAKGVFSKTCGKCGSRLETLCWESQMYGIIPLRARQKLAQWTGRDYWYDYRI